MPHGNNQLLDARVIDCFDPEILFLIFIFVILFNLSNHSYLK